MTTAAEQPAAPSRTPDQRQRHTVLLVDDEPDQIRALSVLLRRDYHVLTAPDGEHALDLLAREPVVHVVLSDQRMPDMSGVELLARARQTRPDAIRLLCTGFADARDAINAINRGHVYRYLTKPVNPDDLKAVIREACERYDLVDERRRLLAQLQRKNDELEAANAELRAAAALKTNFIRVASHELRTPLTILLGLARLAAQFPDLPNLLRDKLNRLTAAAQRLQYLVDQLISMLTLGRFDSTIDRQPCNLPLLLRQAADDVRPFVELRHQHFVTDIADDLGIHHVDVMKLRDSVNHLLLNAIKFTPDRGTITFRARRAPAGDAPGAATTHGASGGATVIEVSDTGIGMPPDHLAHLFQPFFTGHDVSRHTSGQFEFNRQGLGLGLSVVKAFIELHGGTISVRSAPNQGSTFTLTLPAG